MNAVLRMAVGLALAVGVVAGVWYCPPEWWEAVGLNIPLPIETADKVAAARARRAFLEGEFRASRETHVAKQQVLDDLVVRRISLTKAIDQLLDLSGGPREWSFGFKEQRIPPGPPRERVCRWLLKVSPDLPYPPQQLADLRARCEDHLRYRQGDLVARAE